MMRTVNLSDESPNSDKRDQGKLRGLLTLEDVDPANAKHHFLSQGMLGIPCQRSPQSQLPEASKSPKAYIPPQAGV